MTEEMSDLHAKMSALYHKVEVTEGKIKTFEKRISICLELLQEIISKPLQSGILAQKAVDSLELSVLILHKIPPKSSPNRDAWSIRSLSYKTVKRYFPDQAYTRNYEVDTHGNNLHSVFIYDQGVVKRMIREMIQMNENRWEYIGHIRDLQR